MHCQLDASFFISNCILKVEKVAYSLLQNCDGIYKRKVQRGYTIVGSSSYTTSKKFQHKNNKITIFVLLVTSSLRPRLLLYTVVIIK